MANTARQTKLPLKQRLHLKIESLAYGGDGVAHFNGLTVFVPFSAPGDEVEAEVVEAHKSYARARLVKVLQAAAERVDPPCPVAGRCGGCSWQHLDYQAQLKAKQDFVLQALLRIGKLDHVPMRAIVPADSPLYYRNKAQVPVGQGELGLEMGFYAAGSHQIVPLPVEGCYIQPALSNQILSAAFEALKKAGISAYREKSGEGDIRHLQVRLTQTGQAMLVFISARKPLPGLKAIAEGLRSRFSELASVMHNIQAEPGNVILGAETFLLAGQERIVEEIGGFRFSLSADSFFQVHSRQVLKLWELLLSCRPWSGQERILELYCGVGTLSFPLAQRAASLLGVELAEKAVEDARFNAELNQIPNVRFEAGDAESGFGLLKKQGISADLVVLDPPRKGLSLEVLKNILQERSSEILYISCDPGTLARDLGLLVREGDYRLESVTPLDMFPQTYHVESLSYLKRRSSRV